MSRIYTQYFGPNDTQGARIAAEHRPLGAYSWARKTIPYDHAMRREERHKAAALALLASMGMQDRSVELVGEQGKRLIWEIVINSRSE